MARLVDLRDDPVAVQGHDPDGDRHQDGVQLVGGQVEGVEDAVDELDLGEDADQPVFVVEHQQPLQREVPYLLERHLLVHGLDVAHVDLLDGVVDGLPGAQGLKDPVDGPGFQGVDCHRD